MKFHLTIGANTAEVPNTVTTIYTNQTTQDYIDAIDVLLFVLNAEKRKYTNKLADELGIEYDAYDDDVVDTEHGI
jgi:hypothetical protein